MTDANDLHTLAAAYAIDALDADERRAFEAHLDGCDRCLAEIAEHREVTAMLSGEVAPPPHVRDRVLAELDGVEQLAPETSASAPVDLATARRRRRPITWLAAAAAAVVVAVGAVVVVSLRDTRGFDDVASASDATVTALVGEAGTIEVAYSPELDEVALRGDGVADLDPTLRYALWAIVGDTPVPAGLYRPDGGSLDGITELADVPVDAWGITIESSDGADRPTGDILFFAEV